VLGAVLAAVPIAAASCGSDGKASATLPPIQTVLTTTTVLTSTTVVQGFYVVKRGDTLGKIARAFRVRVTDLMKLNNITNQDAIQAGQELEIPSGQVVYDTLPSIPDSVATATT
jgi:LysM repeat protein